MTTQQQKPKQSFDRGHHFSLSDEQLAYTKAEYAVARGKIKRHMDVMHSLGKSGDEILQEIANLTAQIIATSVPEEFRMRELAGLELRTERLLRTEAGVPVQDNPLSKEEQKIEEERTAH